MKIQFIGQEEWQDRLYDSGLYFIPEQVRDVNLHIARKLLKHSDLFVEYTENHDDSDDGKDDDTSQLSEEAKKLKQKQDDELNYKLDVINQVTQMDKNNLVAFAKQHWNIDLDKNNRVKDLRDEVHGLIEQYGLS